MAFLYQANRPVAQGQLTQTVYSLVRDQRFTEAVQLLEQELQVLMQMTTDRQQQLYGICWCPSCSLLLGRCCFHTLP